MFKGEIKDTPQNNDSTGIYINASTRNIDLPTKNANPLLIYEKAAPKGNNLFIYS
ncbi:hypothetical protein [Bacillus wiedmannii]|uniref:hypothetical protein n=1 Tax=Bacillus wiedmannii TaxID=1890302 RepID=UPI001C034211|nr:hypothetical protein [Bacillus wiedmannii]